MAKFVLKDASIKVVSDPAGTPATTDLSDHSSSVTIDTPADEVDISSFSATSYREFDQGLKDATITIAMFQDYAAGKVNAILRPLHDTGAKFDLVIVPVASKAVSVTNPRWTTRVRLFNYNPLSAGIGEAATLDVVFRNADDTGVVESIIP